jgi:PAS domain-containing protein
VQQFILQENIKLLSRRLAAAGAEEERRRLRPILAAMERELALLESIRDGVLNRASRAAQAQNRKAREGLIAWFRREYGASTKLAALLDPAPGLEFVEVNETYCLATGLRHDDIVGQSLFARFPENPDDPAADGMHNFYMSLRKVAETLQPDAMDLLRYDVQDPDGGFRERYWRPTTSPLVDEAGTLVLLLQEVVEVTEEVFHARLSA